MSIINSNWLRQMKPRFMVASILLAGVAIAGTYVLNNTTNGDNAYTLRAKNTAAVVTATSSFMIPEYGVKLTVPSDLASAGLLYYAQINRTVPSTYGSLQWSTISFTTKSLLALDSGCTADEGSIGIIARYSVDPATIHSNDTSTKAVGPNYFGFAAPQGTCSTNPAAQQLEQSQTAELQQALSSVESGN